MHQLKGTKLAECIYIETYRFYQKGNRILLIPRIEIIIGKIPHNIHYSIHIVSTHQMRGFCEQLLYRYIYLHAPYTLILRYLPLNNPVRALFLLFIRMRTKTIVVQKCTFINFSNSFYKCESI